MDPLAGALIDPWTEPLLRLALAEVVLIGVAAGAVGCWVIAYGLTYGAESFAHAMLPGLVVAALAGVPLLAGGVAGVVVAAAAVGVASRAPGIDRQTAIAVTVTALVGLGALLGLSPDVPAAVADLLFGSPLAVSAPDVAVAAVLAAGVLLALALLHHRLLAVGFDAGGARALGLRRAAAEAGVLALLAAVVAVAAGALGNLLVIAAVVGPAATARVLAQRMAAAIAAAAVIAAACGFAGLLLSYHAGTAAGASIAVAFVAAHIGALAVRRARRAPAAP